MALNNELIKLSDPVCESLARKFEANTRAPPHCNTRRVQHTKTDRILFNKHFLICDKIAI